MSARAWEEVELGDIITLHRGYDLPTRQRRDGTIPVVSSSGITGYHNQAKIDPPGVVTGRYGTLGEVFFLDEPFWPLNTTLYVSDFHGNDARFVSYLLTVQGFGSRTNAAAVPGLNRNALHRIPTHRPPVEVQCKIAAILAAYDDLIDNNSRRVGILEEMAWRIYQEWFVDFRFPGHEGLPLVDSEHGPIPPEWRIEELGRLMEIVGGGTPSKLIPAYWEPGSVMWFTPTDLTRASAMFMTESNNRISEAGLANSSARLFPQGSVMMTSRATIGVVSIAGVPACTNQGFITCLPNDRIGRYHIYFWIKARRKLITSLASGATFKEINKATFRKIPFLMATPEIEQAFERKVDPIGHLIARLLRSQRCLRESRDLLLPLLISGEIDVSDLDIAMPSTAAR